MTATAAAQRWTLRAGIFILPLFYSPFTYDGYALPKLLFARLLVVVLLLLWLARTAVTRAVVIKRTPLDIPLLLFLGSGALSTVFAESRNVAWLGTYTRYDGLLTLVTYAALFWLAVQSLADRVEARALMHALLAGGYAVSVVAILQSLRDSIQVGITPAFGTVGNPNVLGAFLALVIALAVGELLVAGSTPARVLLGNVLVVSIVALVLTFSRSAWLGTLLGVGVAVAVRRPGMGVLRIALPLAAIAAGLLAVGYAVSSPGYLERAVVNRALSAIDPRVIEHTRLGIWGDSLRLIASRPIVGYGPDNVGLVFPRFQTGDWGLTEVNGRQPIDKAHAELLQVAATQGLLGVATYLLLQAAFLRAVWRARHVDQAVVAGAGWIAYTLVLQLNFTALAAALPFWIFTAAAIVTCDGARARTLAPQRGRWLLVPGIAATMAVVWWGVAIPFAADATLRQAVDADFEGHPADAQGLAAQAQQLAPWESVYAVEVGNVAFEQDRWADARLAYRGAADLGTFNDLVYRNLALADRSLGLVAEAREAARHAVELDRFDPANQALLAEFTPGSP